VPIVLVIIGVALLVTAYNNTLGNLTSALGQDVPGFAKWGVSLMIVGGLGYVPGMQTVSRWLLALVLVVLVLRSYANNQTIFANFAKSFSGGGAVSTSQTDPAGAYAANPASPNITTAEVTGTTSAASATSTASAAPPSPYDPQGYVNSFLHQAGVSAIFDAAVIGFGSVA
jgi:hypothetical protein